MLDFDPSRMAEVVDSPPMVRNVTHTFHSRDYSSIGWSDNAV